jgi:hypothetical protein
MKKILWVLLVFILILIAFWYINENQGISPINGSEPESISVDDTSIDTITKFEDLLLPDGQNMSEWAKKNDPDFVMSFDKESFIKQPGAIKSITQNGDTWALAIDILTPNTKWLPGVDSAGGFFINKNPKIRNLIVRKNTMIYDCGAQYSNGDNVGPRLQDTSNFMSKIEDVIDKSKTDKGLVGEFGYTAYFDILGSDIFVIYQQCLP